MKDRAVAFRFLTLCCAAALSAVSAGPASAQVKPPLQDRVAILERVAERDIQQAKAGLDLSVTEERRDWAVAEALLMQSELGEVGREYLLHDLLLRIRAFEPDADALDFVVRMQDYDSKVYVAHEEGPLPVAVYPIAAAAEGTRRLWQRREIEREAAAALAAGDMNSLEYLREPGTDAHAAVLATLRDADSLATRQAAEWLATNADSGGFYEARAVTALRGGDRETVAELLRSGTGAAAIRLLMDVRGRFEPGAAFDIFDGATANPSLASAALFEIDALRSSGLTADIDDYLLAKLADAALGGTAAAVIARRGDHDVLVRVAGLLAAPGQSAGLQSKAALALRLADSPYARRVLENAVENDGFADTHLRDEVSTWLED